MQTCIKNNKKMEKEKYYTPIIEEFHVGFEFDYYDFPTWEKVTMDTLGMDLSHGDGECALEYLLQEKEIRVKYLDREDIESFGFKKRLKDEWIGWKDYALDTISGKVPYFLSATIHIPRMDDCYKIYLHRYLDDDTKLETMVNEGESELVYKGKIKNRSELFRLLKQLSII